MKVWITRNRKLFDGRVSLYHEKPRSQSGMFIGVNGNFYITEIFIHDFKKMFGFTPRRGHCKQYEITLKEIKQKQVRQNGTHK